VMKKANTVRMLWARVIKLESRVRELETPGKGPSSVAGVVRPRERSDADDARDGGRPEGAGFGAAGSPSG
jgi:hypothetical protein